MQENGKMKLFGRYDLIPHPTGPNGEWESESQDFTFGKVTINGQIITNLTINANDDKNAIVSFVADIPVNYYYGNLFKIQDDVIYITNEDIEFANNSVFYNFKGLLYIDFGSGVEVDEKFYKFITGKDEYTLEKGNTYRPPVDADKLPNGYDYLWSATPRYFPALLGEITVTEHIITSDYTETIISVSLLNSEEITKYFGKTYENYTLRMGVETSSNETFTTNLYWGGDYTITIPGGYGFLNVVINLGLSDSSSIDNSSGYIVSPIWYSYTTRR